MIAVLFGERVYGGPCVARRRPDAATKSHHTPTCSADRAGARGVPFDDPAWLFEPKYDGFRGLLYVSPRN
jgi:hypothetical protein